MNKFIVAAVVCQFLFAGCGNRQPEPAQNSAPAAKPRRKYQYVVKEYLRDVTVDVSPVESGPPPEDPGDAGTETLEGIDSDNDGVRDDVELWIQREFPGPENQAKRHLLYLSAMHLQWSLQHKMTKNDQLPISINELVFDCGAAFLGEAAGDQKWMELQHEIIDLVINTRIRMRREIENSKAASGGGYSARVYEDYSSCSLRAAKNWKH